MQKQFRGVLAKVQSNKTDTTFHIKVSNDHYAVASAFILKKLNEEVDLAIGDPQMSIEDFSGEQSTGTPYNVDRSGVVDLHNGDDQQADMFEDVEAESAAEEEVNAGLSEAAAGEEEQSEDGAA